MKSDSVIGCLLGTAVGDALGLPYEGLSPGRARRLLGPPDRYRFIGRCGMVSDDTEHSRMVLEALLSSDSDPDRFETEFARRLKWWLLCLPAGCGLATARACMKLWLGFAPSSSGVFSAGNGPAMRSAVLGTMFEDVNVVLDFVRRSTRITHTDPKALFGAQVVALAAWLNRQQQPFDGQQFLALVERSLPSEAEELLTLLKSAVRSVQLGETTPEFAASQGMSHGVSGYVYQTVPVAIHAWLAHSDCYENAVQAVIDCGGDADTTAAIVGGIVGAGVGPNGIPAALLSSLWEWPYTVDYLTKLASDCATAVDSCQRTSNQSSRRWLMHPGVPLRNIVFLIIVLSHGFRRLLPPW